MIYREHYIELFVNGKRLELENQQNLNMRFNRTILDPTKVASTQAEYSFSFSVPSTPNNDVIFEYANNLSKVNKFHPRWAAEVYADGIKIFDGTITLNSYKDKKYNINLVSVKLYSLDEIFGDSTLADIPWYKPFNGAESINYYNENEDKEVSFPLVSYGAFQKAPESSDEVGNNYTSKFVIDKYNRWWVESFYPSLNMLQTIKKAYEWKGYNVGGNAFADPMLKDIFMSTNLGSEQVPVYNLGNPRFGYTNLTASYTTDSLPYEQELEFPYFEVWNPRGQFGGGLVNDKTVQAWNYDTIRIYDLLEKGSVNVNDTYMYDPNEKCIVIPADGFYKIDIEVSSTLNTTGNLTFAQNMITNDGSGNDIEQKDVTMAVGFNEVTPIEIQLVRNYDDNIELIKGKNNKKYVNGNPTKTTNFNNTSNIIEWLTCFPHQDPYNSILPTKKNDLTVKNTSRRGTGNFGGSSVNSGTNSSTEGGSRSGGSSGGTGFGDRRRTPTTSTTRDYSITNYGYIYKDGDMMAYDQAVSDGFICGFSTMLGGTPAVMKNGYSWSKSVSAQNFAFYNQSGYNQLYYNGTSTVQSASTVNENEYIEAPSTTFSCSNNRMSGRISCMVYLNKNDVLELFEIHRAYNALNGAAVNYTTTTNVNLKITAASPNSYGVLKSDGFGYNSDSQFDYDLRLSNFLNNETTISSFIDGVVKAFNLQLTQEGNNIWLDSKSNDISQGNHAIEFDNRVNSDEAESSMIDYPKEMSVRYKINTDEWGFEKSVQPQSMLNEPDWEKYGDSGFTVIKLNDDSYVTSTSNIDIPFSYTWYDNFTWYEVDSTGTQDDASEATLRIPVISTFTYMIDGYDYDESMKHDGYSLTQRLWFRPKKVDFVYVMLSSQPKESIQIYVPSNIKDGINLSYKTNEKSLLRYFNVTPYLSSNYVTVEAYITPEEYNLIKNGAYIHFDSDIYIPTSVEGYDPTNYNKATIKMITKIN